MISRKIDIIIITVLYNQNENYIRKFCEYFGGAEMWHLRTSVWFRDKGHQVKMLLRKGPLAEKSLENGLPVKILPMSFDLDLFSFLAHGFIFKGKA